MTSPKPTKAKVVAFPTSIAPTVDVENLLLSGNSAPKVPAPMELQTAIERRAKAIGEQARLLAKEHLQRRVAYYCEYGHPTRVIDLERAYVEIAKVDIGSALAAEYRRQLNNCLSAAELAVTYTQNTLNDLRKAIADLDKQQAGRKS